MNKIHLSKLAEKPLTEYLKSLGYELHFLTGEDSPVYDAVKTHADIHMCQLGLWENTEIFPGNPKLLAGNYPGNIIYNAVFTGKYFIHNLKYTNPELLDAAKTWHEAHAKGTPLHIVDVPQGYTRCTLLPVDESSFITSDEGIAKALADYDAEVLLIEKGHIALKCFDYGFIGGCTGHIITPAAATHSDTENTQFQTGKRTIIFNGNLAAHPDYKKIAAFIKDRDINIKYFSDYPLTDIGSILTG